MNIDINNIKLNTGYVLLQVDKNELKNEYVKTSSKIFIPNNDKKSIRQIGLVKAVSDKTFTSNGKVVDNNDVIVGDTVMYNQNAIMHEINYEDKLYIILRIVDIDCVLY